MPVVFSFVTEIVTVQQGELTAAEILSIVDDGGRVNIETSVVGTTMDVMIRKQNGLYYCDTPTKLLTHESKTDAATCLIENNLARADVRTTDAVSDPTSV